MFICLHPDGSHIVVSSGPLGLTYHNRGKSVVVATGKPIKAGCFKVPLVPKSSRISNLCFVIIGDSLGKDTFFSLVLFSFTSVNAVLSSGLSCEITDLKKQQHTIWKLKMSFCKIYKNAESTA